MIPHIAPMICMSNGTAATPCARHIASRITLEVMLRLLKWEVMAELPTFWHTAVTSEPVLNSYSALSPSV